MRTEGWITSDIPYSLDCYPQYTCITVVIKLPFQNALYIMHMNIKKIYLQIKYWVENARYINSAKRILETI